MMLKIISLLPALLASAYFQTANALALNSDGISRRGAVSAAFGLAGMVAQSNVAFAGTTPPTAEELARIKVGYDQIQYLLANFDSETTVCRENGGECKRAAEPIRKVLGLRSTTDPLFQIDKVFDKVRPCDYSDLEIPPKRKHSYSMY
jgi:hypothetical protein